MEENLDEMKNLSPEERLKKLKEIEKKEVENIVYGDDSGELRVKIMKSKNSKYWVKNFIYRFYEY